MTAPNAPNAPTAWLDELRAVPLAPVFAALDIRPGQRGTFGPCPACGATKRGKEDSRGPLGLSRTREGWRCWTCDASGDALTAARLRIGEDWRAVRGWYADRGWTAHPPGYTPRPVPPPKPPPPPPPRPPVDPGEVRALLSVCVPLPSDLPDRRMLSRVRGLAAWLPDGAPLPRWATYRRRDWRDSGHRVLIPLYDPEGRIAGIRARAADRAATHPKALPPAGHSTGGLCMASPTARAWLRGTETPEHIVIVEGEPAWVIWCGAVPEGVAVLGIISGSWTEAWRDRIAETGASVLLVMDHDGSGDKYAATWSAGLSRVARWPHEKDDAGAQERKETNR